MDRTKEYYVFKHSETQFKTFSYIFSPLRYFFRYISVITSVMKHRRIAPIFMSNHLSSTVGLPIDLARKYEIDNPCYVIFQDSNSDILIKKLQVKV